MLTEQQYLKAYRNRQRLRAYVNSQSVDSPHADLLMLGEPHLTESIKRYEAEQEDCLRQGQWIPTVSGRRLFLEDPCPTEIEPFDIAYGVSRIPRYNGMTVGDPFMVAQHLVVGSYFVKPGYALHWLLHDAHEYSAMDITSPLKRILGDAYKLFEDRHKQAVADHFGLVWTDHAEAEVKRVDNQMWVTEVDKLTPYRVVCGDLPCESLNIDLKPLPWREAFTLFARRLNQLMGRQVVTEDPNIGQATV